CRVNRLPYSFDHLVLPSFPTRRSSDLWGGMGYSLDLLPAGFGPDTLFNVQSYYNTPGGPLKGYELTYQQPFTFLPGIWSKFGVRSEEHTSELQSRENLVCRLLLEKKKN